jgi:hypothetical protein
VVVVSDHAVVVETLVPVGFAVVVQSRAGA